MLAFLLAGDNIPFTVSLSVMLGIAFLEGVGSVIGFGISGFLDSLVPDGNIDISDYLKPVCFQFTVRMDQGWKYPLLACYDPYIVWTLGLFVQAIVKAFHFLIPWYIVLAGFLLFFHWSAYLQDSSRIVIRRGNRCCF